MQHEVARVEDFGGRVERGHGFGTLLEQHELVELALDDAVHLAAVGARQAGFAGVAHLVFVEEHERVHGGVQRVMAQESQGVGAAHFLLGAAQDAQGVLEGGQQLARLLVVHGGAQAVVFAQLRAEHRVEQRVGALVAQQERLGLVAGPADIAEEPVVDVLAEEVVRDECGHGAVPRF